MKIKIKESFYSFTRHYIFILNFTRHIHVIDEQKKLIHKPMIKFNEFNSLTTIGHPCPKQWLQGVEPPAVVSHDRSAPKTNLFCRKEVFLSNKVQSKVDIVSVFEVNALNNFFKEITFSNSHIFVICFYIQFALNSL